MPKEATAAGKSGSYPASDVLWLVGSTTADEGYVAQAVAPDGSVVAQLPGLPYAVARTRDGQQVLTASGVAGKPTAISVLAAGTGAVLRQITGGFDWPAEPDVQVAVDPAANSLAVVGTFFVGTPDGDSFVKQAPDGSQRTIATKTWRAYRGIEIFDLATGARSASADPTEVQLGTSVELSYAGDEVLLVEHGPDRTDLDARRATALGRATRSSTGGRLRLLGTDPAGRSYLLTSEGNLLTRAAAGAQTTARIDLFAREKVTAKPFMPTVLATSDSTVAVVDQSRLYLASIEVGTGRVRVQRSLGTSRLFTTGPGSIGADAAVDVARRRIYLLDKSGVSGGVWVHDADTLEVLDRWHSDVAFALVWVAPSAGTVYLQSWEGPIAVHDSGGALVSFVPSSVACAQAI